MIAKVVAELMERLERKTAEAIRGALDRSRRTNRPRFADIDWPRTIRANLRHYQPEHETIVPERLVGFMRQQRRLVDLDEVILCVDQSGSMATLGRLCLDLRGGDGVAAGGRRPSSSASTRRSST